MIRKWGLWLLATVCALPTIGRSQTSLQNSAVPTSCPVEILSFDPSGVSVQIRNTSGKTIVGLIFNAAISDATEHWKWLHWDFDEDRPLRDFGWNKAIKPGATKRLGWGLANLDFEHSGGGVFVLTSVLYEDGTDWQESPSGASCRRFWYKHKRFLFRQFELPPR